jgi:myb proto-oncogene protein
MKEQLFKISKIKKPVLWTKEEDSLLLRLTDRQPRRKRWRDVCLAIPDKSPYQCYLRYRAISPNIRRGAWTAEEDQELLRGYNKYGKDWRSIARTMKTRNSKQIRDRYTNYLDPGLCRISFTLEDDLKLIELHNMYGNRWSLIKERMNRPYDCIKNRFNTALKKNLKYYNMIAAIYNEMRSDATIASETHFDNVYNENPEGVVKIFDLGSWE